MALKIGGIMVIFLGGIGLGILGDRVGARVTPETPIRWSYSETADSDSIKPPYHHRLCFLNTNQEEWDRPVYQDAQIFDELSRWGWEFVERHGGRIMFRSRTGVPAWFGSEYLDTNTVPTGSKKVAE